MSNAIPSSKNRNASALRARSRHSSERIVSPSPSRLVGGRYRILKRAGEGMTASVYLAADIQTHKKVVVKQLAAEAARDSALAAHFMGEVHAIAGIDHPNVVRILDYGAPAYEQPFLVMEALAGETLSQLLRKRRTLEFETALFLSREAALGLLAVHRTGTVHRDIKPHNLFLVGPLGNPLGVKIIDFGMAKLPDGRASTAGNNWVVGTLQYMPPEQALADPVDARADIYSLGIVMFQLFTGHLPFEGDQGLDMLGHQLLSPLPPPSWLNDKVDPRIESIIIRATRMRPENRYPSMAALLSDLERICNHSSQDWGDITQQLTEPDEYRPVTERAQEIAAGLAQRFRRTPRPPPPEANDVPESAVPFALARKR